MERTQILEEIGKMTVLELSQLIKDMEEKFGVSAAAAVAVAAPAAAGGGAAKAEEKTEFTVMLTAVGDNKVNVIKAGAMPNAVMSAQDIKALAQLPSREQLIAKLLGTLQAPMVKLVRTLNEVPARFVRTLAAYHDAKSGT